MKTRMIQAVALSVAVSFASQARAAELLLPKDGWASWQVEAVEDSPSWCCWSSWDESVATEMTCKLDGDRQGYGTRGKATTEAVRVYAHFKGGKVERLRVLSATCPVETKAPIQNLDNVATDDSARWLTGLTRQNAPLAHENFEDDVLAALAMHRGEVAMGALSGMARSHPRVETRKQASFWLAEVRGTTGAEVVSAMMFNDKDAEVRKHAEFALTQSKSPRIAADLIKVGNTDAVSDVRAQSWFWLAQTGAANAEEAIIAASKQDPDDHVREQAIFALSQLPDERSTNALIAAVEDRSLAREQRKRALFWLAQSESAGAQAYLEKMLVGNTAR